MTIRERIAHDNQKYVDTPVYQIISKPKPLAVALAHAFGSEIPQTIEVFNHYKRFKLQWVTDDGKGGLIPRS